MVYTVTFNPAIDYVVRVDRLAIGMTNRSSSEQMYVGGKGINVSMVLSELGIRSKALGFVAGFTGRAIEDGAKEKGVETDFVHLESGCSRINVKIKSDEETEINGQGPSIPPRRSRSFSASSTIWLTAMFSCWRAVSRARCRATSTRKYWRGSPTGG